jgi:hypothetical protein
VSIPLLKKGLILVLYEGYNMNWLAKLLVKTAEQLTPEEKKRLFGVGMVGRQNELKYLKNPQAYLKRKEVLDQLMIAAKSGSVAPNEGLGSEKVPAESLRRFRMAIEQYFPGEFNDRQIRFALRGPRNNDAWTAWDIVDYLSDIWDKKHPI